MERFAIFFLLIASIAALPAQNVSQLSAAFPIKPFIIGGDKASDGQFPWQVGVFNSKGTFCGGSLINDQWILTAGHCVQGPSLLQQLDCFVTNLFRLSFGFHCFQPPTFEIFLGSATLVVDGTKGIIKTANYAIAHPDYDNSRLLNDVALIKMDTKVTFGATILSIPLSSDPVDVDTKVTVAGWGKTKDTSTSVSYDLKYVSLRTISNEQCAVYYGKSVNDGTICAIGKDTDNTCQGDSGGALIQYTGSTAKQVGVVSFVAAKGCELRYPSGYASVPYFLPWIKETSGV